jgi:hypothetical protein
METRTWVIIGPEDHPQVEGGCHFSEKPGADHQAPNEELWDDAKSWAVIVVGPYPYRRKLCNLATEVRIEIYNRTRDLKEAGFRAEEQRLAGGMHSRFSPGLHSRPPASKIYFRRDIKVAGPGYDNCFSLFPLRADPEHSDRAIDC